MKKVVLSLLAFGLVGAAAFAQDAPKVTIGEWGRQLFSVSGGKDASGNTVTQGELSTSWGDAPRIVGLNIQADGGNAGFSITPDADSQGNFGLTDQNKAWIKPLDGVIVESGWSLETDTWRGIHDFGNWNWLRFNFSHNDSVTFSRLGEGGYATDINYNKDGVGAWALLKSKNNASATGGAAPFTAFGEQLQIGGAYTIKDIGQIKAQYLGYNVKRENLGSAASTASDGHYGTYEVAFNLSAVKGLYEEVGLTIPSDSSKAGYTIQVSDQVGYAVTEKATINAQIIYASYKDSNKGLNVTGTTYALDTTTGAIVGTPAYGTAYDSKSGAGIAGGVGIDYDLGDSVGVSADLRYQNKLANNAGLDKDGDDSVGFGIGLTKGYANGLIGVAFEYAGKGGFAAGGLSKTDAAWAIPLRLEYWF